jgi:hypothetical protein
VETPTGSKTPLVDEPIESYETVSEQIEHQEINNIGRLPQYSTQPQMTAPRPMRNPMTEYHVSNQLMIIIDNN